MTKDDLVNARKMIKTIERKSRVERITQIANQRAQRRFRSMLNSQMTTETSELYTQSERLIDRLAA